MDFAIHGSPTPRAQQRHLPGSARRPPSGKSQTSINPITGEEVPVRPVSRQTQLQNRPPSARIQKDGIPSLDLRYLRDEDVLQKPIGDVYDISLDTPNTASTVSWGVDTDHLTRLSQSYGIQSSKKSIRPESVPSLNLQDEKPVSSRPKPKQHLQKPSARDQPIIPENLPPPSSRHQEMYKQYAQEMKDSYRTYSARHKEIKEEEVKKLVEEVKKKPLTEQAKNGHHDDEEVETDVLKDSWSQQRYTSKQLLKKMDADELREYNKKQKLVETVMVDQLSRAVISDPEQDQRTSYRAYDSKRGRGSNRFLHDSKISTRSTATENLLSRRVRFGARILNSNGHDAVRELTGFFFHADNTLTIYEFRKFGKSAKAMPFIYRGEYKHVSGPKAGQSYTLLDIFAGANLMISTSGQQTLPESLSKNPYVTFRVTEVDEEDREALLMSDIPSTERQESYSRLMASHQQQMHQQQVLDAVQEEVHRQICKRAIKTRTGLGRYYRAKDDYNTGMLPQFELERGLTQYHISLPQNMLDAVYEILDPEGEGSLLYSDYLRAFVGEMNEYRKTLVRKAFVKCDGGKKGYITKNDVRKFFNANAPPTAGPGGDVSALQAFLDAVCQSSRQEEISFIDFEEYYEGLSIAVQLDEAFANILRNSWNI